MLKIIIIIMLIFILGSLASALYYLLHDSGSSQRMVKALTIRISLSLAVFILLIVAFMMGWITPHGLGSV